MSDYLSIDLGSSYAKAAVGGHTVCFPAVVTALEAPRPGALRVRGNWYAVGRDALCLHHDRNESPHKGEDYHGSVTQYVQVVEIMRQLGSAVPANGFDRAILNLPYHLHGDEASRERIRSEFNNIAWADDASIDHKVALRKIIFAPQGGGAILEYFCRKDAPARSDVRYIASIDVGGHTTDVVTMAPGTRVGEEKIIHGASKTIAVNVHGFFGDLVAKLRMLPGAELQERTFSYFDTMDDIAQGGTKLRHLGRMIDISGPVAQARKEFTRHLQTEVSKAAGDWWPSIDVVLLSGGGAGLVDVSVWDDPRITVLDSLSNVRGQALLAQESAPKPRKKDNGKVTTDLLSPGA